MMTLKTILAVIALALSPTISLAMCSGHEEAKSASVCSEGQSWDTATQSCITPTNS